MFDKQLNSHLGDVRFSPMTLRDVVFSNLPHRNENCNVIFSHIDENFVTISLLALRAITASICCKLRSYGFSTGDTVMLASFSSSNELANALIFTAATCLGIRVFVPIFPEPSEFESWYEKTGFRCILMPCTDILAEKGYEKEKEVIATLQNKCGEKNIPFLDSFRDFNIYELIKEAGLVKQTDPAINIPPGDIRPETEAVIFTTSGTSGISKLLVYTHQAFANCCQAWQMSGLFREDMFGNPGFSPLFTHTIGIRTFINSVWSGNPFCILVTDWFLRKPEIARYLLLKMNPGHLISGPAFYNTMLELFRQYPELKTGMMHSLKAAISIGAPFDETTAHKFKSATGILMMNGLGTTETLMVTLNMHPGKEKEGNSSLGMPLPGVTLGLTKTDEDNIYELFIRSGFQSLRTIGEVRTDEFFASGDLVQYDEGRSEIFFHSRKSSDFIKDEYGVKIPLNALRDYYPDLYRRALWIEWIPLVNIPGLAALLFMPADSNNVQLKEMAALVKRINEFLRTRIEPFEYTHRHLERITVINDEIPLTRKGTVSRDQILKKYDHIIAELRNPFVYSQTIEQTETGDKSDLFKYSNPLMAELLEALKLDKVYLKGEGNYLFYSQGDKLQRVTDFVGGFGANLLGHNHPAVRKAIIQFLDSACPALNNQGSQYYYPSLLAKELNRLFSRPTGKNFKVQFGNSGTEATEIAIHHAYFEWRQKIEKIRDEQLQLFGSVPGLEVAELWDRNIQILEELTPCIIVVNNCFHGYSSASRSLLDKKKQRCMFSGLLRPRALHVSDTESDWKNEVSEFILNSTMDLQIFRMHNGECIHEPVKFCTIIASVIEPVRGEGGISEVNPQLAEMLSTQDFPLISDEIQCGLGRTGSIPSCPLASYYLLGKSLGGGIEKISAVLIDDQRFRPSFPKYYSSTFANGEMAAFCGLATLNVIEEELLTVKAEATGSKFLLMLKDLSSQYPDVISSVNGRGLMLGIHFNHMLGKDNIIFRILIENDLLGYLFAAWFLNTHNIRVLPSLSKPDTLRIEPSYYLSDIDMKAFCDSLEELCNLCRDRKIYELCRFLMNGDPYPDKTKPVFDGLFPMSIEEPARGSIKAGFIGNFTLPHRELQVIEPDFRNASDTGLRILFSRLETLLEGKPLKIMSKNLMNGKVHFTFYILPYDTSQMEIVSRWGKKRFYIARIQEAADMLKKEGADCISLGAHTSIISGNGLNIAERIQCKILTGNTLTVASCLFHLNKYINNTCSVSGKRRTIAIVGAGGNIGSGLIGCLDEPGFSQFDFILAGNNEKRLLKLKEKLSCPGREIECTSDLFTLKRADIIICCVNTNDPIIFPHHVGDDNQVYIIDISVPSAISEKILELKNVQFCAGASSVFLHNNPDLLISSHTHAGKIFCCAAESIICALYHLEVPLKGHIVKESVIKLLNLGIKEGLYE